MAHLQLGDRFDNVKIEIDINTFRYDGHTSDYDYPDPKLDAHIQFCAVYEDNTDGIVQQIREGLARKYRVDMNEYVKVYEGDWFNYHTPARRTIKIRLPSGSRGITNPAYFSFSG